MLHKAIEFAIIAHQGQFRKGSHVPYIVHPFETAQIISAMLDKNKYDENIVIAGLLHDTLEDTPVTYEQIKSEFNAKIAELVAGNSEDKSLSWEERKQHTVDNFSSLDYEVQIVCFADKLSNLRSLKYDYDKIGDELWNRFNRGVEQQKWYYSRLAEIFIVFSPCKFYAEFLDLYKSVF